MDAIVDNHDRSRNGLDGARVRTFRCKEMHDFDHVALLLALLWLAACCGSATEPNNAIVVNIGTATETAQGTSTSGSTNTDVYSASTSISESASSPPKVVLSCQLPSPKRSMDACQVDADCAPSIPCHATECVAKTKAQTTPMPCTREIRCDSADVNYCGCLEGTCALIPGKP